MYSSYESFRISPNSIFEFISAYMQLSAFDLDHTLITVNSSFSFCKYLYKNNILTLSDMIFCICNYLRFKFFGLSILTLHQKVFHSVFFGKRVDFLQQYVEPFITTLLSNHMYLPANERLKECKKNGHAVLLLSNSPDFLVGPIAERLGFSAWSATQYEVDRDGKLVKIKNIFDGEAKKQFFVKYAQELGITSNLLSAYSDSDLDLPLFDAAEHRIAVRPNKKLFRIATENCWEVI